MPQKSFSNERRTMEGSARMEITNRELTGHPEVPNTMRGFLR
jgi:hypothetical protein